MGKRSGNGVGGARQGWGSGWVGSTGLGWVGSGWSEKEGWSRVQDDAACEASQVGGVAGDAVLLDEGLGPVGHADVEVEDGVEPRVDAAAADLRSLQAGRSLPS